MKQLLNLLVALLGALILGGTVLIGLQNPPPTEVRRPMPTATATTTPPSTSVPVATATPFELADLPRDRRGMILATQPNGTLLLIAANGAQSWTVDLNRSLTSAAWAPDGGHIVAATSTGDAVVTHPERQDARSLLGSSQRLAGDTLSWTDPLTVALALESDESPATVALWSYLRRDLELLGPGRAAAVAQTGAVAWITPDGRSIMVKRGAAAPTVLINSRQLGDLAANRQTPARHEISQSSGAALAWSIDGTRLAFTTTTPHAGGASNRAVVVVTLDGQIQQWPLAADTGVYQLGWMPDGRLLFTGDQGLSMIDPESGSIARLLPQQRTIRYFALHPDGANLIISTPNGLYKLSTMRLEWPQVEMQPFGPRTSGYQRLDWCCRMMPRLRAEP
jgi:hypothetical protein